MRAPSLPSLLQTVIPGFLELRAGGRALTHVRRAGKASAGGHVSHVGLVVSVLLPLLLSRVAERRLWWVEGAREVEAPGLGRWFAAFLPSSLPPSRPPLAVSAPVQPRGSLRPGPVSLAAGSEGPVLLLLWRRDFPCDSAGLSAPPLGSRLGVLELQARRVSRSGQYAPPPVPPCPESGQVRQWVQGGLGGERERAPCAALRIPLPVLALWASLVGGQG